MMYKFFDYAGTGVAMIAYLLITSGEINALTIGLIIGTGASAMLLIVATKAGLRGMITLQFFFICANMYALLKLTLGG